MNLRRFFCVVLLVAGSLPAQTSPPKIVQRDECGPLAKQVLKCPKYGFTYQVIFGWVDRTADMQQDETLSDQTANESSNPSGSDAQPQPASSNAAKTLLAVFERPPGAPGDTINSAVVIAAEPLANYHGIKTAADYLNPISELAQNRGFKVVNEPYAFAAGIKQLARADFSKERGKLTMWQSSLVMIEKGSIVSFTFIGGSEDEVEELVANLNFMAGTRRQNPVEPAGSKPRQ